MGVLEDVRGLMQETIAPELKTIRAELDALKTRFDKLEQVIEHKFAQVEQHSQRRHDETMFAVRGLIDYNNLNQRLSQLEKKTLPSRSDQ